MKKKEIEILVKGRKEKDKNFWGLKKKRTRENIEKREKKKAH